MMAMANTHISNVNAWCHLEMKIHISNLGTGKKQKIEANHQN
jgi:hypothetical protein